MRQANTREGFTEELLVSDLLRQGLYHIRTKLYGGLPREVDIIAMERDVLCFIEVKSRTVKILLGEMNILLPKKKDRILLPLPIATARATHSSVIRPLGSTSHFYTFPIKQSQATLPPQRLCSYCLLNGCSSS